MKPKVEVLGLKELARKLELHPKVVAAAAAEEVKETTIFISSRAQQNIVDNESVVTGTLLRSIRPEISTDGLEGVVGTNVEYAPYVEFGTRRSRAKPYLYPAFEVGVAGIMDRLKRRLER